MVCYLRKYLGFTDITSLLPVLSYSLRLVININYNFIYFRHENIRKTHSMWLLAPLISKLPCAVQGRVLKVAGKNKFIFIMEF